MHTVTLSDPGHLEHIDRLRTWLRPRLQAGQTFVVTVGEEKRNVPQNAKLHSMLGAIAKQKEWAGQKWESSDWKRLLTAAWMRAHGQSASVIPSIDGYGFDVLYRHTSNLTKMEMSELIDFIQAWAIQNGIELGVTEA
jgi:hypothetical protein